MVWMMWLNNEDGFKEEPNTIRMSLIHVPARLLIRGNKHFFRLAKDYAFKEQWIQIENSILELDFA